MTVADHVYSIALQLNTEVSVNKAGEVSSRWGALLFDNHSPPVCTKNTNKQSTGIMSVYLNTRKDTDGFSIQLCVPVSKHQHLALLAR